MRFFSLFKYYQLSLGYDDVFVVPVWNETDEDWSEHQYKIAISEIRTILNYVSKRLENVVDNEVFEIRLLEAVQWCRDEHAELLMAYGEPI